MTETGTKTKTETETETETKKGATTGRISKCRSLATRRRLKLRLRLRLCVSLRPSAVTVAATLATLGQEMRNWDASAKCEQSEVCVRIRSTLRKCFCRPNTLIVCRIIFYWRQSALQQQQQRQQDEERRQRQWLQQQQQQAVQLCWQLDAGGAINVLGFQLEPMQRPHKHTRTHTLGTHTLGTHTFARWNMRCLIIFSCCCCFYCCRCYDDKFAKVDPRNIKQQLVTNAFNCSYVSLV